ncbi:MAG: phosphotransferase enzyme family protein [Adlercreutzia equolifaciens]
MEGNGALARALGVDGPGELTVLPLAQGEHNANFVLEARDGRRFVLRVNYASQLGLDDQIGYEFAALRALASSGRTPEPLYVDGTRSRIGRGALVESFVEGAWIDLEDSRQVREAARALADVHSVAAPRLCASSGGGPLALPVGELPEALRRLSGERSRGGRVMREVDELFVRAQRAVDAAPVPSPCECSHILNAGSGAVHFLIDDTGRASIVDWEKPVLGEVAQDLAYFLSPTTTIWDSDVIFSAPERAQFLKTYWEAVGGRFPRGSFDARFPAYRMVNALVGITWSCNAWVEYHDPARPLRNEKTLELLPIYFSEEFLDLIRRDCFDAL